MAGRRCRALSCWALATLSFASFIILYKAPWQQRIQAEEIDEKSHQANIDMEVSAENSGTLKHMGRNLDYNDDSIADDDHDEDYDGEDGGDLEQKEKKKRKRKGKETVEEKRARRLKNLAEDQTEYRQWVRRRREEKRRGRKGEKRGGGRNGKENKKGGGRREDLKTMSNGKKLHPREFDLWKDLLSLDEDDDLADPL